MNNKDEVITFKVDEALGEQLRTMPNRSEFIRQAVLHALEMECPLCHGTGTLTPNQMAHWREFREHHELTRCSVCGEPHLTCQDNHEEGAHSDNAHSDSSRHRDTHQTNGRGNRHRPGTAHNEKHRR